LRQFFLGGGRPFAEPPADLTLRLYDHFRPEVEEMEKLLQRDLVAWKSAGLRIPELVSNGFTREDRRNTGKDANPDTAQSASA
jgi:hypothetical protein